jgi:hypothetical protein
LPHALRTADSVRFICSGIAAKLKTDNETHATIIDVAKLLREQTQKGSPEPALSESRETRYAALNADWLLDRYSQAFLRLSSRQRSARRWMKIRIVIANARAVEASIEI